MPQKTVPWNIDQYRHFYRRCLVIAFVNGTRAGDDDKCALHNA